MTCKVAIIGGGIAGVTAASTLNGFGITDIRVFESSSRYGGRVKGFQLSDDITVNLGANWMFGEKNPILNLLQRNPDVKIFRDFEHDKQKVVFDENFNDITCEYQSHVPAFITAHEQIMRDAKDEPISIEEALEKYTSYEKPSKYLYDALQYIDGFEALCGTPNTITSVLDMDETDLINDIGEGQFMTSNTEAAIAEIAKDGNFDLKQIELNRTVVKIRQEAGQFTLLFQDGEIVHADNVIITVAVPIFQQRKIDIDFMPAGRYKMFDSIPFVDFANCWVLCDQSDEKHFDETKLMYLPASETNPFRSVEVCPSILHHFNRKVLRLRALGTDAIRFNAMSKEDVKESLTKLIEKTFKFRPTIENFSQPQWSQLESHLGCYSNTVTHPVGADTMADFYQQLGEPIADGFYFAGAAYMASHCGYVTGAYYTGQKVANEIRKNRLN